MTISEVTEQINSLTIGNLFKLNNILSSAFLEDKDGNSVAIEKFGKPLVFYYLLSSNYEDIMVNEIKDLNDPHIDESDGCLVYGDIINNHNDWFGLNMSVDFAQEVAVVTYDKIEKSAGRVNITSCHLPTIYENIEHIKSQIIEMVEKKPIRFKDVLSYIEYFDKWLAFSV